MSAVKGLSWSATTSIVSAAIDVVRIAVLVRFLAAEDFGLFAISLIVVGFCQIFSEGGIGNAVVSRQKVTPSEAGSVLNFSVLMGVAIYLLVLLSSPWVASFYQAPELTQVLPLLTLVVPVSSSIRIMQAMMQRQLDMRSIAIATLSGKLLGLLVAWLLAWQAFGIYALVWSTIVTAIFTFALLVIPASRLINYRLGIQWRHIQPILSFSMYQFGELLLTFFSRNFDVALITKMLDAEIGGVYVVCKNLLVKGGDVVFSTFSRYFHPKMAHLQGRKDALTECYLQYFRSVTLCIAIAYLLVVLNTEAIVSLLLGGSFSLAVTVFPLMSYWLIVRYSTAPVATLWLVRQKPQIGIYWNLVVSALVPLGIWIVADEGITAVLNILLCMQMGFLTIALAMSWLLLFQSAQALKSLIVWLVIIVACVLSVFLVTHYLMFAWYHNVALSLIVASVFLVLVSKYRTLFLNH